VKEEESIQERRKRRRRRRTRRRRKDEGGRTEGRAGERMSVGTFHSLSQQRGPRGGFANRNRRPWSVYEFPQLATGRQTDS